MPGTFCAISRASRNSRPHHHVAADDFLGLDEGPVDHAGRGEDFATGVEPAAHVDDAVLELLLPCVEATYMSCISAGEGGSCLPEAGAGALRWMSRYFLVGISVSLVFTGPAPRRYANDARRPARWTPRRQCMPFNAAGRELRAAVQSLENNIPSPHR